MNVPDKDKYVVVRRDYLDHIAWMACELKEYLENLRNDSCPICRGEICDNDENDCLSEFDSWIL